LGGDRFHNGRSRDYAPLTDIIGNDPALSYPEKSMRRLLALTLIVLVASRIPAQEQNRIAAWTPEAMMRVKDITSVQPSPDGKRVAYAVREAIMEGDKSEYLTHIHVAKADGSDCFQLTHGDKSCSDPQWSPDGEMIAFVSNRSGKNNIWLIRMRGGEAWRLTDVPTGVGVFRWAPDGKQVAFTAMDPRTPADEKASHEKDDARVVDEHFQMHRLYVIPVGSGAKSAARKLTTGAYSVGSNMRTDSAPFDWSPDGKTIAFTHTPTPKADDWRRADISLIDVASGKVKPLAVTGAAEMSPYYSPDGRWIAYLKSDDPPTWGFNFTVHVISSSGGAPRELAETFDRRPTLIGWHADGKQLIYTEAKGTQTVLRVLPLDGKPEFLWTIHGVLSNVHLNATRTVLGFGYQLPDRPIEAFILRLSDNSHEGVSTANRHAYPIKEVEGTELRRWKSPDGLEIEGLLTLPVNYEQGKRYPLLLVIHGGPMNAFSGTCIAAPSVYPIAAFAERGYAVLRANPRGSSGYGKRFRYANYKDWGGGDFKDLMAGVDAIIKEGIADPERLGVMGWSYGGFMTSWILTQTKRFKAASVGAGVTDLMSFHGTTDIPSFLPDYFGAEPWDDNEIYRKHSALFNVKGVTTPTLIQHGEKDERVPISQGYELHNALKRQGCTVKMIVYPRTPHALQEPKLLLDVMRRNVEWFDKYLGGGTTGPGRDR
jgi:dipeptidyl aminopeptidase/acylaminoacyl peptidase